MAESVRDIVRREFNQWSWLFNHPEIGPLLRQAVDPNTAFSPNTFKAKVMATRWWKGQSAAQRDWQMKVHNDPASAKAARNLGIRAVSEMGVKLGVRLSNKQKAFISEVMNQKGLSPDDPAITSAIYHIYQNSGRQRAPGAITSARKQLRSVATREYFVPLSRREEVNWGINVATGRMTEDDFRQQMSARAQSRYKHVAGLSEQLSKGASMRDLFDGHIQTIADTLEIDPDMIDLSKGRWSKIIDSVDPETGKHKSLSLGETETLARRDERYWNTKAGKQAGASMAQLLYKNFGMR